MALLAEKITGFFKDDQASVFRFICGAIAMEPANAGTRVNRTTTLSDGATSGGATTLTITKNWTGANLGITAVVYAKGAATGVTWDGVALTKVLEVSVDVSPDVWTMSWWILPTSNGGNFDLVVSFGSFVACAMVGAGVTGLHQTTPTAGTASEKGTASEAAISFNVTEGTLTDGRLLVGLAGNPNRGGSLDITQDLTSTDQNLTAIDSGQADTAINIDLQDIDTEGEAEKPRPPPPDEPPGGGGPIGAAGEPGVGDPAVGPARVPRRGLRGRRGRRGFKAGPPGFRGKLPPTQGDQIDKSVPDEYKQPLIRKWLDFGWLIAPMLEGQKTITLRDWGTIEGVQWQHGELFYAYDGAPMEGGRRLALCRVMQVPFVEFTARLRMADYHKLGFSYAMANQLTAPSGRTALQVWEDLISNPQRLWLLRFVVERIFEQGRKEQDTVQIAERPPDAAIIGSTS